MPKNVPEMTLFMLADFLAGPIVQLVVLCNVASAAIDNLVAALEPWPGASPASTVVDAVTEAAAWQEMWGRFKSEHMRTLGE